MPDNLTAALDEIRTRSGAHIINVATLPIASDDVRTLLETAGDVPRLLAALDAVLELHSDFRIYDECDHHHTTEDVEQGLAFDTGDFVSCDEVYMYSICRECCTEPEYGQTEECASDHGHSGGRLCRTREDISRALLGEDG